MLVLLASPPCWCPHQPSMLVPSSALYAGTPRQPSMLVLFASPPCWCPHQPSMLVPSSALYAGAPCQPSMLVPSSALYAGAPCQPSMLVLLASPPCWLAASPSCQPALSAHHLFKYRWYFLFRTIQVEYSFVTSLMMLSKDETVGTYATRGMVSPMSRRTGHGNSRINVQLLKIRKYN